MLTPDQIKALPINISAEQVIAAKDKFKNVSIIKVRREKDDITFAALFKQPDRKIMNLVGPYIESNMPKAAEVLVGGCFICGDEEIKHDAELVLAAGGKVMELMPKVEVEVINF